MGPWDIMSQHFVERTKPPPGISSFTKIRLGWITPDQVIQVNPGSTRCAFLSPLSKGGETLAVKIPIKRKGSGGWSHFYLVENRQPVGYDRILPDHGLLVLKVNLHSVEGSGTVKVMDADPDSPHFSHATFKLGGSHRNVFIDKKSNVAVLPLWSEEGNHGVLVTTPEKSSDASKAALMVRELFQRFPEPRGEREVKFIEACVASFKRSDFRTCYQTAKQAFE
jgi:hypothetical protein